MKWFNLCTVFAMSSSLLFAECSSESMHIWGEAIYWKPVTDGVGYLATKTNGPPNPVSNSATYQGRTLCPHYHWGFRAGAGYRRPGGCLTAELSGGYIDFRGSGRVIGFILSMLPVISNGVGIQGSGRGSFYLSYWELDLRVRGDLFRSCAAGLNLFGGVKYVNLHESLDVSRDGVRNNDVVLRRQRRVQEFSGVGPEAGIAGSFCLWGGLRALGELGFVTLIGTPRNETRTRITNFTDPNFTANQAYRYDHCVTLVPGMTARAVLRYRFCWCFVKADVQVGYDLLHYWGVLHRSLRTGGTNPTQNVRTLPVDMGFAGPSFALGLSF